MANILKNIDKIITSNNTELDLENLQGDLTSLTTVNCTGGLTFDITDGSGQAWKVHQFTTSGLFNVHVSPPGTLFEYIVVAGGGGGVAWSGGGGAGGYRSSVVGESSGGPTGLNNPDYPLALTAGTYTVIVGAGGTEGIRGGDSSFDTIVAIGGGSMDTSDASVRDGGSGCGGKWYNAVPSPPAGLGTNRQGHDGGLGMHSGSGHYSYGGGGGAGGLGGTQAWNTTASARPGGAGITSSITGTATTYAQGGGGMYYYWGTSKIIVGSGSDGSANSGGGGAGEQAAEQCSGGSGIVVIRYKI